jgi:hypothetical protein
MRLTVGITFFLLVLSLADQVTIDSFGNTQLTELPLPSTVTNLIRHLELHPDDVISQKGLVDYKMNAYGGVSLVAKIDIPQNTV